MAGPNDKLRWLLSRHIFGNFRQRMPALRAAAGTNYSFGSPVG
jgi:hypothetical protein